MASNLGGMTSPISSPQNIFAIQEMGRGGNSVSWLSWFAVALPIAFVGNLICWGALLTVYQPNKTLKEVRRLPDTTVRLFCPWYHWISAFSSVGSNLSVISVVPVLGSCA